MTVVKDLLRLQTDLAVAGGEFVLSRLARKRLSKRALRGEKQPVLLLPGYMAGDDSMAYLRDFLNDCGFDAHTWGLGKNGGFQGDSGVQHVDETAASIIQKVRAISAITGKKVALVGQSLGGLYSRETAARYPDEVDRVITLGSPTIHPYISDDQNSFVIKMASRDAGEGHKFSITGKQGFLHWGARFPDLPCIAIWSPIDAIVFSQSARIPDYIVQLSESPAVRENVRIICSHTGMAFSEVVLLAVADRLAQPIDDWRDFDARDYYSERAIALVEKAFGNRLFHEFIYSDWRDDAQAPGTDFRPLVDDQADLMRQLRQDHNDFYQLYSMIEQSIESGSFGSDSDYLLLADVARFMTDYLDRRHHPLEEFVFNQVLKFHPEASTDLQRLSDEHERIGREGAQLLKQVEHSSDPRNTRQPKRLLARWRRFCETLRRHVELEEQTLFPQAEQHIPDRAWAIIESDWQRKTGGEANPLSDVGAAEEFRHLFEYLSYIASRDQQSPAMGDNLMMGKYLDSVVYATERLDDLLERKERKRKRKRKLGDA